MVRGEFRSTRALGDSGEGVERWTGDLCEGVTTSQVVRSD